MPGIHVVLHPIYPAGVKDFLKSVPDIVLHCPGDEAGVVRALEDGAQVLATYTWRNAFLTPSLRWIAGCGAGFEQYPLDRLAANGVKLTTAAGVHSDVVAEHAFALLLAVTRRVGEAVRNMGRCHWEALIGEELFGKKLAILGMGRIGEAIALRARNWGMQIAGTKRRPEDYRGCLTDIRSADRTAEICQWADIVVLAAPASADGSPLIGARELGLLGEGWIVNVGRGSLIDEPALVHGLTSGALKGAGLDVTASEPLPADSPLWQMPNVVITGHNAGSSFGFGPRWGAIFNRNLAAFAGSGEWTNLLDLESAGRK